MRIIQLLFFLFISFCSIGQTDTLKLVGVLQDDDIKTVDCGVAIVSSSGKIKIETFSDSTYNKDEIIVLFVCPGDFGFDSLIKGERYKILMSNDAISPYGGPIKNTMVLEHFEHLKEFNNGNVVWAIEWEKVSN